MPRKIIVRLASGSSVLQETKAENELELQELVKNNPDLLPIEEFGMTGPLLVVGRETTLPSGGVDLVAIARSGELLVIEFKTGPDNSDFRNVLAQLLDYGSDIWGMSYEEFEAAVAGRYFTSKHCQDGRLKTARSLELAATAVWSDMAVEEFAVFRERLTKQLKEGHFGYVVVAQRFTDNVVKTAEYLNDVMSGARAYAVEIVRFDGDGVTAFETRTIHKPSIRTSTPASFLDEEKFLESVSDEAYKTFLREFLETCRALGFRFEWGTSGVSVRLATPDRAEPLTVAWVFQPGRSGWMGLTDVNFGYDPWSANQTPSVRRSLVEYLNVIGALDGSTRPRAKNLNMSAWHLSADDAVRHQPAIFEAMAELSTAPASPEIVAGDRRDLKEAAEK